MSEREGVFVHSFICEVCGLHFEVFSWQANRHTAANVTCPECGGRGPFTHFRVCLNESREMTFDGTPEIFKRCPFPGSSLMDDTGVT